MTWEEVRDSPLRLVQQAINAATWPEQKAPRIQQVLRAITEQRQALNLDHLQDLPVATARSWLERLPGVGPKTSAAVLLFSTLRRRALPVDTHHYRVARRLGWIAEIGEHKAHQVLEALLPDDWDAQKVYDHHEVMMFHGQRCCFYFRPACARCVLQSICPSRATQD